MANKHNPLESIAMHSRKIDSFPQLVFIIFASIVNVYEWSLNTILRDIVSAIFIYNPAKPDNLTAALNLYNGQKVYIMFLKDYLIGF